MEFVYTLLIVVAVLAIAIGVNLPIIYSIIFPASIFIILYKVAFTFLKGGYKYGPQLNADYTLANKFFKVEFLFSSGVHPGVGLLDHVVVLFFVF